MNIPMQKSPAKKPALGLVGRMVLRFIILLLISVCLIVLRTYQSNFTTKGASEIVNTGVTELDKFKKAFDNQQSNFQVKQTGQVAKILRDDDHSPRHQRFVVQLDSGQKLLIAHNIDLAPKVEGLQEGSEISFYGEYEWNNKGGIVHWTHHDPKGKHPNGWLVYNNQKYQ